VALERPVLGVGRAATDAQAQVGHLDGHLGRRRLERKHADLLRDFLGKALCGRELF